MSLKLVRSWGHSGAPKALSVRDAVEIECDGHDYGVGALEAAAAGTRKVSEMMARLVETLHDRGLLDDEAVLEVLGGGYKVAE